MPIFGKKKKKPEKPPEVPPIVLPEVPPVVTPPVTAPAKKTGVLSALLAFAKAVLGVIQYFTGKKK